MRGAACRRPRARAGPGPSAPETRSRCPARTGAPRSRLAASGGARQSTTRRRLENGDTRVPASPDRAIAVAIVRQPSDLAVRKPDGEDVVPVLVADPTVVAGYTPEPCCPERS